MKTHTYYNNIIAVRLLVLLVAVLMLTPATAQDNRQYAIYNYRNDGHFNGWLNSDVDSITYSCIDTLGIEHDEVVVQEVWTPDSLYRIPLETIDSLGFRAPTPEFREGIFYLRDYHATHTENVDDLTLYFDTSINRHSLPAIGQVVLHGVFTHPYEDGFAGKVVDIKYNPDAIIVICEQAAVGDIFKRLVVVGKASSDIASDSGSKKSKKKSSDPWVNIEDHDVIPIDLDEKSFDLFGGLIKITSPYPKLTCSYYVYISELYYELYARADLHHKDLTYTLSVTTDQLNKLGEYGKFFSSLTSKEGLDNWLNEKFNKSLDKYLKEQKEEEKLAQEDILTKIWKTKKVDIPIIGNGVLNLNLMIAPLLKTKGSLEAEAEFKTDARQSMDITVSGITALPRSGHIKDFNASFSQDPIKSAKVKFKAKGTLTLGFTTLLNINLIHRNVLYAGIGGEFGVDETGILDVTLLDTEQPDMNAYDRLKDTQIKISYYAKIHPEIGISPLDIFHLSGPKFDVFSKDYTHYIMPHFTEPSLPKFGNSTWLNKNPLGFYTTASKDVFIPCHIGMRITDNDGKPIKEKEYTNTYRYWTEDEWVNTPLSIDISDLPRGASYKCYPIISFFGWKPFNAGPVHNFTVPLPMVASPKELTVPVDGTAVVEIVGGWDTFAAVISGDDNVASIMTGVNDGPRHITILGKKEGNSELQIEDRRTGEIVKVPIKVTNEPVSRNSIKVMQESINFGEVVVEASERRYLTIVNEGSEQENVNLEVGDPYKLSAFIGENGQGRWYSNHDFSIAPNDQRMIVVHFNPTAANSYNSEIKVTSKGVSGGKMIVPVYGKGIMVQEDPSFHLSTNSIDVYVNDDEIVEIHNGSGEYDIINNYPDIVESDINVPHVAHVAKKREPTESGRPIEYDLWNITGKKVGKAVLKVKDKKTNEVLSLNVEVKRAPSLLLSAKTVEVPMGEYNSSIEIQSGSGWYNISSDNPEIATASKYYKSVSWVDENGEAHGGTFIKIEGLKVGNTIVRVKDMSSGETATINVTVTGDDVPVQTEVITIPGTNVSFKMIAVEGGTFWMGSPDDDEEAEDFAKPRHQVTLSSFAIGETEVTQALWEAVMGSNPSYYKGSNLPVDDLDWDDCQEFIAKLNQLTGRTFRLPTEAEWEYAARGGKYSHGYKYAGSDDVDAVAWYWNTLPTHDSDDERYGPQPVATKQPNELGLYDMSGNVWEFCQDWVCREYYRVSPSVNPCCNVKSNFWATRGGSWARREFYCRVATRDCIVGFGDAYNPFGFRLALSGRVDTPVDNLSCPDDHHPHMIDLGLPSGTKWACCNVDDDHSRQSPTNYGSHYAWGEVKEKDYYDWSTYSHCDGSENTCHNLGSDIAGTQYDVAHVQWGGSWVMPSREQLLELTNNCKYIWITVNGVNGGLFTGPNGATIFLPMAGYRYEDDFSRAQYGEIWSSTQSSNLNYVGYLSLDLGDVSWGGDRCSGCLVRPVVNPNGKPDNDVGGSPGNGDGTSGGSDPTHDEYDDF